ncbi:MAG: single-stranded DNA-binding protein [Crocinitomix sp.]|nr:single-stranded DNA-binding protein [Crocinitomix sp.]
MNALRNKVQLIGNLGQTPEIISFENGKKLAKISIATNESYKTPEGEKVDQVTWHNAVAWNGQAEIIEKYVVKGQEIAIEGKLVTRTYETKEGDKRVKTEVQINDILLLGRKEEEKK